MTRLTGALRRRRPRGLADHSGNPPGQHRRQIHHGRVVAALRQRLGIRTTSLVADRGMMAQKTVSLLSGGEQARDDDILGCKMRRRKEITETMLARAGRYRKVARKPGQAQLWLLPCRSSHPPGHSSFSGHAG
ncbi:MAG: hypothetical protein MI919_00925 [Holophagales bacterium]|nr:hypothetical protein [Holophagales bacterium]